jgi:hypothetical protein
MPDQVRHDGFGTFYEAIKIAVKMPVDEHGQLIDYE